MNNLVAGSEISLAAAPLRQMLESYSRCLDLGRDFLAETLAEGGEDDLDLDRLERFLNARADLFAVAETSFRSFDSWDGEDPARRALTRKVVAVLEEMTGLESDLSCFLGDRLKRIGETISQLRKVQPVFQRYSHLGGDKADPSRVTRRE